MGVKLFSHSVYLISPENRDSLDPGMPGEGSRRAWEGSCPFLAEGHFLDPTSPVPSSRLLDVGTHCPQVLPSSSGISLLFPVPPSAYNIPLPI